MHCQVPIAQLCREHMNRGRGKSYLVLEAGMKKAILEYAAGALDKKQFIKRSADWLEKISDEYLVHVRFRAISL